MVAYGSYLSLSSFSAVVEITTDVETMVVDAVVTIANNNFILQKKRDERLLISFRYFLIIFSSFIRGIKIVCPQPTHLVL